MGKNGTAHTNGTAAVEAPRSQARALAERNCPPTASHLGAMVNAGINDILLEQLDVRVAKSMFNGVSTLVRVAQNADRVNDLAKKVGQHAAEHEAAQEAASRAAKKAALQAELESLADEPVEDVRPSRRSR